MTAQSAIATTSSSETAAADDAAVREELPSNSSGTTKIADDNAIASSSTQMSVDEDDVPKLWGHSMRPSPTYLRLAAASSKPRQKY